MNDNIKVAVFSHSYLAKENQKNLTALGERVQLEVISPDRTEDMLFSLSEVKTIRGSTWTIKPFRRFSLPFFSSQYILKSLKFNFQEFQPDIIHIEYDPWIPIFWQVMLARTLFSPSASIVCTVKQNTYTEYGILTKLKDWIAKYFTKKVDRFIAVNKGVASIYQSRFGVKPEKVEHITQLGVDTELFKPATYDQRLYFRRKNLLPEDNILVGYCGRLVEDKGIRELIEGVESARSTSGLDINLALLGAGPLEGVLHQEVKEKPWLYLFPVVPHERVADFLKCLDIFILPARIRRYHEEHDAHALLEALATSLPCIGTTSGVIPEILNDVGIVIQPEDPRLIETSLVRLCQDTSLREELGIKGRQKVLNQYSIEAVASQRYEVYRGLVH